MKELFEAVVSVGDLQKAISVTRTKLGTLQIAMEASPDRAGAEAVHVYTGLILGMKAIAAQMFLGFKMPEEVIRAIKGKSPVEDTDYVKSVEF